MDAMTFLGHAAVLFAAACLVLLVGHRLQVPPVVAMLVAGGLVGPYGLGLIPSAHEVEIFAEIGVILLLFVIGIELSLDEVRRFARLIFVGGAVYVVGCILAVEAVVWFLAISWTKALFLGFLVALSSTAIVLKGLADEAQMGAPHGRIAVGTLLFQDIAVAPMMLAIPLLAGLGDSPGSALAGVGIKTVLVVVAILVGGRFVVGKILDGVAAVRSRELLLLSVLAICLGIAVITGFLGLSLSLGAFLAGLVVSDSEVSHSVVDAIVPLRDIFTSIFFMSIGMLFDPSLVGEHFMTILGLLITLIILKVTVGCVAGLCLRYPLQTSLLAALALFQIGEFSFILAGIGMQYGLLEGVEFQIFLAVAIGSMAITPALIRMLPQIRNVLHKEKQLLHEEESEVSLQDHLIIAGYGIAGQTIAQVAKEMDIPYVVVEMNPDTVRRKRSQGESILFGDIAQPAVLVHAGAAQARALVVLISDPAAAQRAVAAAREYFPQLHIIARTRYVAEIDRLLALGATNVVVEEYESAIEVVVRVLAAYLVPLDAIAAVERRFRSEGYAGIRRPWAEMCPIRPGKVSVEATALRVARGSVLDGNSLAASALRQRYHVMVAAVQRGEEIVLAPEASWVLRHGDVAYVVGSPEAVQGALPLFRSPEEDV